MAWCRNGRMSELRLTDQRFDSRSGRYQVATTWMGDCLRTGKPLQVHNQHMVNSAFHPPGVSKSSLAIWLHGIKEERVHLCRVAGDPIRHVMLRGSEMGFSIKTQELLCVCTHHF